MSLTSLLYVSTSTLVRAEAEFGVNAIVSTAHNENPGLGLTGALLFTGEHFAQVLEGSGEQIDALMAQIMQDPRHKDVIIVDRCTVSKRRFPRWSMAYFGPSQFVVRHVTRLINDPAPPEKARAAEWLTELMHEFAKP